MLLNLGLRSHGGNWPGGSVPDFDGSEHVSNAMLKELTASADDLERQFLRDSHQGFQLPTHSNWLRRLMDCFDLGERASNTVFQELSVSVEDLKFCSAGIKAKAQLRDSHLSSSAPDDRQYT